MTTVRLDQAEAHRLLGRLADSLDAFPGQLTKTLNVAINAVATKTKSHAVKIITGRYAIKAAKIRDKIKVKKSKGDYLSASVVGTGRPNVLSNFDHKRVRVGRRRGVKVRVLKSSGHTLLKGGFLAEGTNVNTGEKMGREFIFAREGANRYPIKMLYGPTLVGWFTDEANMAELQSFAESQILGTMTGVAEAHLRKLGMML
jgi:hypothetical protein